MCLVHQDSVSEGVGRLHFDFCEFIALPELIVSSHWVRLKVMPSSNCAKDSRTVFKTILEECICTSKSSDTKWLFKISYDHSAILANLTWVLLMWNNLEGIVGRVKIKEVRETTQNDGTKSLLGSKRRTSHATEHFSPEAILDKSAQINFSSTTL